MKNRLLPLFFVLGAYSAYSQVGVGKLDPNPSTQLEVFANDKGIMIPRVALKSSTDKTTITNGNVNSLLVFNTAAVADVKPGYYYWYADSWKRMATADEVTNNTSSTAAGNGVPGGKGEANYPGENVIIYTDKTTNIVYVQNPDGKWAPISGKGGKDGIAGGNGAPGTAIIEAIS